MSNAERRIPHVRDVFCAGQSAGLPDRDRDRERERDSQPQQQASGAAEADKRAKSKYKTLERHLSMKKTIRKKMMRDLRDIGDAADDCQQHSNGFLDRLKADQPPPANVDKPSLWKRLTKGWSGSSNKS